MVCWVTPTPATGAGRPSPWSWPRSCGCGGCALQPGGHTAQRHVDRDVDDRDDDAGLQHVVAVVRRHLLEAGLQELAVGDDEPERGVLEQDDDLAHDRRHHHRDGLRQQHQPHDAVLAEPDGVGGLRLPLRDRQDARAHHLGEHGAVVHRQAEHDRGERGHGDHTGVDLHPEDREEVVHRHPLQGAELRLGDGGADLVGDEERQEDQDQQRDAAEELHHGAGRDADPPVVRQPCQPEHDAEQQGQHRGEGGGLQRVDQAGQEQVPPDRPLQERRPELLLELALVAEAPDQRGQDGGEQDRHDGGQERVARPGPGAGDVEENGRFLAHRATAIRLASQPKEYPVGRVRIRKPIDTPRKRGMTPLANVGLSMMVLVTSATSA